MKKIPDGYQQVMPYLIVKNAEGLIAFTKSIFGGIEKRKVMRTEGVIMHAEIQIGESVIMCADATDEHAENTAGLFIYVDNCNSTYSRALELGATSIMEPSDQEYGRSAGVRDSNGITWWITGV